MRKKVIIIVAIILFYCVIAGAVMFRFSDKKTLRNFFDDWEAETEQLPFVKHHSILNLKGSIVKIDEYSPRLVLSEYNSRIYFIKMGSYDGNDYDSTVRICSVDMNGKGYIEHFKGGFFDRENMKDRYTTAKAYTPDYTQKCFYYTDGKIIVQDTLHLIEYVIDENIVNEYLPDEYVHPISKYTFEKIDYENYYITDTETNEVKQISFEAMAKSNKYADMLYQRKNDKINSGNTAGYGIINKLQVINGTPYIICEFYNWGGHTFAVVFEYDFEAESYKFVCWEKVGDRIDTRFYLFEG